MDVILAVAHSLVDELFALITSIRLVPTGHGHLLRRALGGTRKASKLWTSTFSETLQSDGRTPDGFHWNVVSYRSRSCRGKISL